ncbi:MAG: FAD:protein FMN transferase [Alphaproteobacteria bacterium]|nr:FAD:protein FMN transferase [Alphaproteobacteria bacterium]
MQLFRYISIVLLVTVIGFYIYQNSPHYQIIKGDVFGTSYKIKIRTDRKNRVLKYKIKEKLQQINQSMSVFEEGSEVSEINRENKGKKIKLSQSMRTVLRAAKKVYEQSKGAFDPTLAPVIDLWGFGPHRQVHVPNDKVLKNTLKFTGFNKLKFYDDFHVVSKSDKRIALDLSAIAKGFAVDEIASLLESEGYLNYVVEIGGEVKAKGFRSPGDIPWVVGVNKPVVHSMENMMVLSLSNLAVATSGNYRNFNEKDGKSFAHTISSKNGKTVQTDTLSVSVFHDSCMYADAYATAMMSMTVDEAVRFADKYNLKAFVVNNEFKVYISTAAKGFLLEK